MLVLVAHEACLAMPIGSILKRSLELASESSPSISYSYAFAKDAAIINSAIVLCLIEFIVI